MFLYTDKRNGIVLEITAYRVPGQKNPKQQKVCIGKMDSEGVFQPNKYFIERTKKEELEAEMKNLQNKLAGSTKESKKKAKEVETLTAVVSSVSGKKKAGLTYALEHIAVGEGFTPALFSLFGEKAANQILSLAYYVLATKNDALDDFTYFDVSHRHPYGEDISSSDSSSLLASITAEQVNGFFKAIRKTVPNRTKEDYFCAFDGTAYSSYSKGLSEVEVSKGKQDPDLRHFAMAAVYSSYEGRCVYYRLYRGNIPDIKTIDNFVDVSKAMGFLFRRIVLDRGYCSWNNLYRLTYECNYEVIMCLKSNMRVFKEALRTVHGTFEEDCTYYLNDHNVYGKSISQEITLTSRDKKEHTAKYHVHVYYNKKKAADQEPHIYGELEDSLTQLTRMVEDKELTVNDAVKKLFTCKRKSFITVRKTSNRSCVFEMDKDAVNEARSKLGYFMLMSTEPLTPAQALDIYRAKDGVERVFNNTKNDIGFDRPAVKTDATLEGKVFVIMLAGMLSTLIRNAMRAHRKELTRKMTYNKVLKELECMYTFMAKGKTKWCEISEKQSLLLKCLGIPLPVEQNKIQATLKKKRGPKPKI